MAGAATGFLGNILWAYVIPPPFQYRPAAAFAIVGGGDRPDRRRRRRPRLLRPRTGRPVDRAVIGGLITAAMIGGLAYGYLGYTAILGPDQPCAFNLDQTVHLRDPRLGDGCLVAATAIGFAPLSSCGAT